MAMNKDQQLYTDDLVLKVLANNVVSVGSPAYELWLSNDVLNLL